MTQTTLSSQDASFAVRPLLDVGRLDGREVVHLGATPIACYLAGDVTTRRHVMVQLAEAHAASGLQIAQTFGVTPVYVSQLRGRFRTDGAAALAASRPGPKAARKVTPRILKRAQALRAAGRSDRAIARTLGNISRDTVRRMLADTPRQVPLPAVDREQIAIAPTETPTAPSSLASEVGATPMALEAASTTGPSGLTPATPDERLTPSEGGQETARSGVEAEASWPASLVAATPARTSTRYAGAMLLHVALAELSLWQVFSEAGAQLGRTALSVAQVVGVVALGFALRFGSIERFKTALVRDFGLLLGLRVMPSVQTLRTHLAALAESVSPETIMRALLAAYLRLEPVWERAYYVDGHFSPYGGEEAVRKGWNSKRRLAEPGHTDAHVHDATGRALFFLNRPMNDSLVKALPEIVREIRGVVEPNDPVILVFDRGGYSGPAFRALTEQGIGYITYLKGRKARRRFPSERFVRRWWAPEDPAGIQQQRRYVYRLYERGTRVRGAGVVRTLVMEDEAGGQIPILTNCDEMPRAKVVHLLRMRWRQENSFKYLSTHYGIEQIIQYGATTETDERMVDNPARARLRKQIADLRATLVFQEADVGQAIMTGTSVKRAAPTAAKRARLVLEGRITRLEHRLARTPAKVPARTLPGRPARLATLKSDRHDLVTNIKLATYNAERLLARRFFRHYDNPRDWLTIFRSLLRLPGEISQDPDGTIQVSLRPPDQPRVRRALLDFVVAINDTQPRVFGTGPVLFFTVQDEDDPDPWRSTLN